MRTVENGAEEKICYVAGLSFYTATFEGTRRERRPWID